MKIGSVVNGCKVSKFRMKTSYQAHQNCFDQGTNTAKSLRFYHDNLNLSSWELKDEEVEFNFKNSKETVSETFVTFDPVDNVNIVTCEGTPIATGDENLPLNLLCDSIGGFPLSMCVGPSGKSCSMSFRDWGKLLVTGQAELLMKSAIMDEFKESYIFYDFERLTLTGLDHRSGQDAKKPNTVLFLGKVITEILRKKHTENTELTKWFGKEKWEDIDPQLSETIQYQIVSSPYVNSTTMNRSMGLTSGFDIFTHDPQEDSLVKKDTVLNNSGYYALMEIIKLDEDYTSAKTQLDTIKTREIFKELALDKTKPMIVSPKDLPAPDI